MNLRATVHARGQVSVCMAVIILIINLVVPGLGTALLACFVTEAKYLSPTALAMAKQGGFTSELR